MYRVEDMDIIQKNINKIKDSASLEYKYNYEPTVKEISEVCKIIVDYIKSKKRIVYGGYAQNLLLMSKNKDESIYREIEGAYYNWPDLADIEFYSYEPLKDLVELTDLIYLKKFKHIEGKEGVHSDTYKIFVNFLNYGDITYMPKFIYDNLPTIQVNGIICTHPHFMAVDAYRVITDPLTSYYRLDKAINRFNIVLKYYPFIEDKNKNKNLDLKSNKEVMRFIRKKICQKSKLVTIGFAAYNYYASKLSSDYVLKEFPYYEFISANYEEDALYIYNKLNKKFPKKITVKEFCPFFTFSDHRVCFYYDNYLVCTLYNNNERCTVYRYSEKKKIHFGTFNLVFMYFLFSYYYAVINKIKVDIEVYNILITKFLVIRNLYLTEHNKNILDDTAFKDFTLKCYGEPHEMLRESFIKGNLKKKEGKQVKFTYKPTGKPGKVPKFIFSNCSGNENFNKKYLIFKK